MKSSDMSLCGRWQIQHSALVRDAGEAVSQAPYAAAGWHEAAAPTTVLNALVHAGVYPDPRYGLNNYKIPDASDEFNAQHDLARYSHLPDRRNPWKDPWWFRCEFDVPMECGERQRLVFNAINYRAEVWLNGRRVAGRDRIVGAFRRFRLDVTGLIRPGRRNVLAVRIWPPDHCGVPQAQLVPFQTPRAHVEGIANDIRKDVCINLAAVGYDCSPTVRDRLMGIGQEVFLEWGGPVRIVDPFVRASLPLPALAPAALTIVAELVNDSPAAVTGVFRATIEGAVAEEEVCLAANETKRVLLSPERCPALLLASPRLWWPVGYGAQDLYELKTEFLIGNDLSDRRQTTFGIRSVEKVLHEADGAHGLRVTVNGRRVFCRGGYLLADALHDWARLGPERWEAELRYLVHANLNTISFEDLPNLPRSILDLADRLGLMVWACFFQCHWLKREDFPLDHDLLEASAADLVRRCRSHPSVVVYMCMNEGAAAESQYRRWRRQTQDLDGSRILIPSGYGDFKDWSDPATYSWPNWILPDTPVGANDLIPKSYGWQDPAWFFRMVRNDRTWMFKIESGSASIPTIESLRMFLSDLDSDQRSPDFPLNREWASHGSNSYFKPVHEAICRRMGPPESLEDYWWKASALSYEQHRAMFDAVHHRMWELTSGFLEWKLNSSWPDTQWQIYDYFLRPTPSFYAIRKACAPIALLLDPLDDTVAVVTTGAARDGLALDVRIYDARMRCTASRTIPCHAAADACTVVHRLDPLPDRGGIAYVWLELSDAGGNRLADNLYWRDTRGLGHDRNAFAGIGRAPRAAIKGSWRVAEETDAGRCAVDVALVNPSRALALLVRVRALDRHDGDELLPVLWSDNYVCLPPGREVVLRAELPTPQAPRTLAVALDGWNVSRGELPRMKPRHYREGGPHERSQ